MKFKFEYKGQGIELNVKECPSVFSKALGLMFRRKSKPLLFIFKKPVRQGIHSFFCLPFIAIWFDKEEIVDVKVVQPWKLSVKPLKKFDKLLEIPSNDENFKRFVDERNL